MHVTENIDVTDVQNKIFKTPVNVFMVVIKYKWTMI